jgi:hypothetical protein
VKINAAVIDVNKKEEPRRAKFSSLLKRLIVFGAALLAFVSSQMRFAPDVPGKKRPSCEIWLRRRKIGPVG